MHYTRPVYPSLNKPMTLCGVDRRGFFLAVMISFGMFSITDALIPVVILFIVLMTALRMATRSDPQFLRILMASNRYAARYDPAKRQLADEERGTAPIA